MWMRDLGAVAFAGAFAFGGAFGLLDAAELDFDLAMTVVGGVGEGRERREKSFGSTFLHPQSATRYGTPLMNQM